MIPDAILSDIDRSGLKLGKFVWAPSGRFIYFEGQAGETRNVWRVAINPATLAWAGSPERLTTDVGDEADIALSADGARLAFTARSQSTSVWSLDFDAGTGRLTGSARALTAGSAGQVDVDTRDGRRLAYRVLRAGRNEMRELTPGNREERVLLVSTGWSPSSPRWSSDGRLAYGRPSTSTAGSGRSVVAVLSPERREEVLTLPDGATLRPSDWWTDGRKILGDCRTAPGESMGICSIAAPGSDRSSRLDVLVHDPTKHLYGPRLSPDQQWVSFVAVDVKGSTTSQVYVAPVAGGPWIPVTDGRTFDDKPRWTPDGQAIYFVSNRSGYLNVRGRRFDPARGAVVGDVFSVTAFNSASRSLPSNISQIEFAIADRRLFLPLTETQGQLDS